MKFRKKPVVIDAWQLPRSPWDLRSDFWAVVHGVVDVEYGPACLDGYRDITGASIKTLEGVMRAEVGDWIIRGVKGELYPCKPDIFAATYEAAEGEGK